MLKDKLKNYQIILASGSPRRQQFFRELDMDFEVRLKPVEEVYSENLKGKEISDYLAKLKASVFENELLPNEILITSDTVVWHQEESLAKAKSKEDAITMLRKLSGGWHEVITSVCLTTTRKQIVENRTTKVKFSDLSDAEILYYINNYQPYDKAGAYGIQEWIGLIAIEEIKGPYTNVVGLPSQLVYKMLTTMVE